MSKAPLTYREWIDLKKLKVIRTETNEPYNRLLESYYQEVIEGSNYVKLIDLLRAANDKLSETNDALEGELDHLRTEYDYLEQKNIALSETIALLVSKIREKPESAEKDLSNANQLGSNI